MSQPKYTPGPWTLEPSGPNGALAHCQTIVGATKDNGWATIIGYVRRDLPHDARLIAAAPELYEFLASFDAGRMTPEEMNRLTVIFNKIRGGPPVFKPEGPNE